MVTVTLVFEPQNVANLNFNLPLGLQVRTAALAPPPGIMARGTNVSRYPPV
jgi:hypothetical protein